MKLDWWLVCVFYELGELVWMRVVGGGEGRWGDNCVMGDRYMGVIGKE